MARTVQDAVTRVQQLLQDTDAVRYPVATDILPWFVDAMHTARSVRPDLFVANYGATIPDAFVLGDTFPLPDQFFVATVEYIAGNLELRDDEFAVDGRAVTLKQSLTKKLVSGM
jgi:hypothetical protein